MIKWKEKAKAKQQRNVNAIGIHKNDFKSSCVVLNGRHRQIFYLKIQKLKINSEIQRPKQLLNMTRMYYIEHNVRLCLCKHCAFCKKQIFNVQWITHKIEIRPFSSFSAPKIKNELSFSCEYRVQRNEIRSGMRKHILCELFQFVLIQSV